MLDTQNTRCSVLRPLSWCLYDWANSAFSTVIITFIYSIYFARSIIGDETIGASYWGYALAGSGLLIALASPFFGALADYSGRRKPWLLFFTLLCCVSTALLFFGVPGMNGGGILFILGCVVIANIGLEIGGVFYNAMLPDMVRADKIGRLSGFAWALGYIGGLVCLVMMLFGFVGLGDSAPLFSLPRDQAQHIRITAVLVAGWFLLFSLPLFLCVKEPRADKSRLSVRALLYKAAQDVRATFLILRTEKNLGRFLIASALYRDGLNTLFALGGLYAAAQFGMEFGDILIFAIGLNVTAGIGAFGFAFLDDARGSKLTIMLSLTGLIILGAAILMIEDKNTFLIVALFLGLFIGPAQAASRTLAARLAPQGRVTQIYGFYALSGKSIAFTGPLLYGLMTDLFHSQQAGLCVIISLWVIGMIMLYFVRE